MPAAILLAHLALATVAGGQADAAEVVRQSDALLLRASSVQGTYVVTNGAAASDPVRFILEKPNHLVLRSGTKVEVFNGDDRYVALLGPRTYERRNVYVYGTPYLIGFTGFIKPDISGRTMAKPEFGRAEYVRVGDRTLVRHTSGTGEGAITVDIDPVTKLPARWTRQSGGETYVASYSDVVLDGAVPNEAFDIPALTAGLTPKATAEEGMLPAVGSAGADLQGTTLQGRKLALLAYAAQRRATVVAFVRPGQPNSLAAVREIRDAVAAQKDAQLLVIADEPDPARARRYLKESNLKAPTLAGQAAAAAASAYGVRLYPTVIILDAAGNVSGRMLGYDREAFVAAIAAPSG